jgi:hypothetical protein
MGAFHKLSLREMLTPSEAAGETKTNKWMVGDTKEYGRSSAATGIETLEGLLRFLGGGANVNDA